MEVCPGCGFEAPAEDGPMHDYMTSSPACWRRFTAIMAREYQTPELMPTHYLGVDAYAAQHPGDPDERRARQSVWVDLAGLHTVLREGREPSYRYALLRRLADAHDIWPATPHHRKFPIVAGEIAPDQAASDHIRAMRAWADATLSAYAGANPDLAARLSALG